MTTQPKHILTRQSARKANACYSDERLAELIPEDGLTVQQVAKLDIPTADRIWALCYAVGADDRTLRLFAVWTACRALSRVKNLDPRSIEVCNVAELFAIGQATAEELSKARLAAGAAADAAADAADAAAYAADAAARTRDRVLAEYAEWVVEILIDMKAPGCQWLDLVPVGHGE